MKQSKRRSARKEASRRNVFKKKVSHTKPKGGPQTRRGPKHKVRRAQLAKENLETSRIQAGLVEVRTQERFTPRPKSRGYRNDEIGALKCELKERIGWPNGPVAAFGLDRRLVLGDGIVGVGFGVKRTRGRVVLGECLRVYVKRKLPKYKASMNVPTSINGMPTDVIETPAITPHAVECGNSVGHFKITAGTIGCVVTKNGQRFILSNNHVLANCNIASIGDAILQPGRTDGGHTIIASLEEFHPLDFKNSTTNSMDAAIARLDDVSVVAPTIRLIGPISSTVAEPTRELNVKKCGRTTGLTCGKLEGLSEDFEIRYGNHGSAYFEDQIAIRANTGYFSRPGDSGSLIVTQANNHGVGLLFAGEYQSSLSFATPLTRVLRRFAVSIVP